MAAGQKVTTGPIDASAAIGSGTLEIRSLGLNKGFSIAVEAGQTINDIAAQINGSSANFGVTASVVKGDSGSYLTLSSNQTGDNSVLSLNVTDSDGFLHDDSGLSQLAFSYGETRSNQTFNAGESFAVGSFDISNGTDTATISVLAGETIEQVVDKINAAGINVTASLEDDNAGGFKLVYQSSNDYGNHQVAITSADASMSKLLKSHEYANFTENTAASKAQITLNGSIVVTSETNTFENAVAGLSLEVKKAHDATASDNIKINLDKGSTEEAVKKFVESYNEMFAVVAELTQVNEDGTAGQLVGDSTIRTMMNQLRGALGGIVTIDKFSTQSLASIGIKTERDGTLSLNEATLTKQLNSNFEQFGALFAGDEGIGKALSNVVSEYKGIGGIVESKIKSATSSIDRINEERTDFDERMGRYEARLFSQFTTMDLLVSQLQATGDYLTAQLDALSGINKKK